MRVLLRRNVSSLGKIGEVVDVKPGYARNHLLPMSLAVLPTETNVRVVEAEKQAYLQELAKQRAELEAKAAVVQGKEITISARANEEGHLYGSVGPAQIAAALAEVNIFVEPHHVAIEEPLRKLDRHEVLLRFSEDVTATIHVWIVPVRDAEDKDQGPPAAQQSPKQQPS